MFTIKKQARFSATIPLAVFAGAALGAAITLLFAPKKGSDTRKMIGDKANDFKNRFGKAEEQDLNEDRAQMETSVKSGKPTKSVSMHAIRNDNTSAPLSKTESMVHHLKHTKQEDRHNSEPI